MSSLSTFWSQLDGTVHPADVAVFKEHAEHGFDLSFPPPAFIGDVDNAPVLILENNGGYDPSMTPSEFAAPGAADMFRDALARSLALDPYAPWVSLYYLQRNYRHWLASGQAALVNGVAYRSVSGRDKAVAKLTKLLPSAAMHRRWLAERVLPSVRRGERLLIVHRWARWPGIAELLRGQAGVIFSSAPISKDLTSEEMMAGRAFLDEISA